jgi:hypothetical protein
VASSCCVRARALASNAIVAVEASMHATNMDIVSDMKDSGHCEA